MRKIMLMASLLCAASAAHAGNLDRIASTPCLTFSYMEHAPEKIASCEEELQRSDLTEDERFELLKRRARGYLGLGGAKAAIADIEKSLIQYPDNPILVSQLAFFISEDGSQPQAMQILREALARHPYDRDLMVQLALFVSTIQPNKDQQYIVRSLFEHHPDDEYARYLFVVSFAYDAPREVIPVADKLVSATSQYDHFDFLSFDGQRQLAKPQDVFKFYRATALWAAGDLKQSLGEFQELYKNYPGNPYLAEKQVAILVAQGEDKDITLKQAIDWIKECEPKFSDYECSFIRGETIDLLRNIDDPSLELQLAAEFFNHAGDDRMLSNFLTTHAHALERLGRYDEAAADIRRIGMALPYALNNHYDRWRTFGYYDGTSAEPWNDRRENALRACLIDVRCTL